MYTVEMLIMIINCLAFCADSRNGMGPGYEEVKESSQIPEARDMFNGRARYTIHV